MEKKGRIGTGQLYALLFLCRLLTTLTFSPSLNSGFSEHEWIVEIALMIVFLVILAIPQYFLYKNNPKKSILEQADAVSEKFSRILAFLYFLAFIFFEIMTVTRFDMFVTSLIYPEMNITFLIVISLFFCGYAAYLGIEAISRASVMLLAVVLVGIVTVLAVVSAKYDVYNNEPLFYYSFYETLEGAFTAACKTSELIMLIMLAPKAGGNVISGFFKWIAAFVLIVLSMFIVLVGVLGDYARTQLFPFYSLALVSEFSLLERMDSVITAIWILSMLIKSAVLFYLSSEMLLKAFKTEKKKTAILSCCVLVSVFTFLFTRSMSSYANLSMGILTDIITVTFAVALPIAVLIIVKVFPKRRKKI